MKHKQTVLIVDDDKANIDVLISLLHEYDTIPCLNGEVALDVAYEEEIDLILLDIVMPGMDGFEVCTVLKADTMTSSIPIIFLSAKYEMSQITKGFELGAVDYITKPFNPLELKCRVKTHLALQSYHRSLEKKNIELLKLNKKIKEIVRKDMSELIMGNKYLSGEDVDFDQFNDYLENITVDD